VPDEDMAHFRESYSENYLYLLEVDPSHVHVFWEVVSNMFPDRLLNNAQDTPPLSLKIYFDFLNHEYTSVALDYEVSGLINDQFIEIDKPFFKCYAELGYYDEDTDVFVSLCSSNSLESLIDLDSYTPPYQLVECINPDTMPEETIKKEEESLCPDHSITSENIVEYYKTLSERLITKPFYTPWKSIIEHIDSMEAGKSVRINDVIDIFEIGNSDPEAHFSDHTPT
jgi:hypothetical protein